MRRWAFSLLLVALMPAYAAAIPLLQLYIDGAVYDTDTDSWVTTASSFDLWVIGNVSQTPGGVGIADVRLAVATPASESGSISFTPTTTTRVTDPSTPSAPTFHSSGVGNRPVMSDGSLLPSHGIYGPGTQWTAYGIGNLTLTDSPVGDFINSFPSSFPRSGQINVYTVTVAGFTQVHFDAYNHVTGVIDAKFAPFSHDGETAVPEPGTVLLVGAGLVSAAGAALRKRRPRFR